MQAEGKMFRYVVSQWNKIRVPCLRLEENIHYYKIIVFPNFFLHFAWRLMTQLSGQLVILKLKRG